MGIFNKIFGKKNKASQLHPGVERNEKGKWVFEKPEPTPVVVIKVVPATTSGKADCVCGSGTCKCAENRRAYTEAVAEKINKAVAAKSTKLDKVKADAEAMKAKGQTQKPAAKKAPATKKPKA